MLSKEEEEVQEKSKLDISQEKKLKEKLEDNISEEEIEVIIDMRKKLKIDFENKKLKENYWLCKISTEKMICKIRKHASVQKNIT